MILVDFYFMLPSELMDRDTENQKQKTLGADLLSEKSEQADVQESDFSAPLSVKLN